MIPRRRYCLTSEIYSQHGINDEESSFQENKVNEVASAYIDDIFINKSVTSATYVKDHLSHFKLAADIQGTLKEETEVLGQEVCRERVALYEET